MIDFWLLCLLALAGNVADAGSTWWALKNGAREANPALLAFHKWLTPLPHTGKWLWLLVAKGATIAVQWGALLLFWPATWIAVLTVVVFLCHAAVAAHNMEVARVSRKQAK